MKKVTKEQFKDIYFKFCNSPEGENCGYDQEYWNKFFEGEKANGMSYRVEEPRSLQHTRMTIVTDYKNKEYRLFFITEKDEEDLYDYPSKI